MTEEKIEQYERYYQSCTKLFSRAIARVLESDLDYKKKLDFLHKIDEAINAAAKKRF